MVHDDYNISQPEGVNTPKLPEEFEAHQRALRERYEALFSRWATVVSYDRPRARRVLGSETPEEAAEREQERDRFEAWRTPRAKRARLARERQVG